MTGVGKLPSFKWLPEGCLQSVKDLYRLRACSGSHQGVIPGLERQREQASIFQVAPRGVLSECRGPE